MVRFVYRLRFQIKRWGRSEFEETPLDAEGYQFSAVLKQRFKLVRERDEDGIWDYILLAEPI